MSGRGPSATTEPCTRLGRDTFILGEVLVDMRARQTAYAESTIRAHGSSRVERAAPRRVTTPPRSTTSAHSAAGSTDHSTGSAEMLIAGSVDLDSVLAELAVVRPVFHSEADFQLAFAWQVQQQDAAMQVRLETRPAVGVHLDLAFSRPDMGRTTAVELKYLTRLWSGIVGGERYELKNHGAQDIRAYDIVKDISRVEKFIFGAANADGAVIVLANDSSYWRPAKIDDTSNAAAFRVSEGVVLNGTRSWGPNTGFGTMKARELPLELAGRYELRWSDYSTLPLGGPGRNFRKLVVPVVPSR